MYNSITDLDSLKHQNQSHPVEICSVKSIIDDFLEEISEECDEILILQYTIGDSDNPQNNRTLQRLYEVSLENPSCKITLINSETQSLHKPGVKKIINTLTGLGVKCVIPGISDMTITSDSPDYHSRTYGIINHAKAWVTVKKDESGIPIYNGRITTGNPSHTHEGKLEAKAILSHDAAESLYDYIKLVEKNDTGLGRDHRFQHHDKLISTGILSNSLRYSKNSTVNYFLNTIRDSEERLLIFVKDFTCPIIAKFLKESAEKGVQVTLAYRDKKSKKYADMIDNVGNNTTVICTHGFSPKHHANVIISDGKEGITSSTYPAQYATYQQHTLSRSDDLGVFISNAGEVEKALLEYLSVCSNNNYLLSVQNTPQRS